MLRIVPSTDRKAVAALLSPARIRDAATERKAARIVSDVRARGDRALKQHAAALDGLSGPLEQLQRLEFVDERGTTIGWRDFRDGSLRSGTSASVALTMNEPLPDRVRVRVRHHDGDATVEVPFEITTGVGL